MNCAADLLCGYCYCFDLCGHFVCAVVLVVSIEVDYCTCIDMNLGCIGWMGHFGFSG